MAKKLPLKVSKARKVADQDLPGARLPDSAFAANSNAQVVYVQENQRVDNSYNLLMKRGRDTSEVQELRKAGFGQDQPKPKSKPEKPKK